MEKILVLRGGALGDFIVTLPALAALRRHWPSARIELAGNPTAAALAHARGLVDAVHSQHEGRWAQLYGREPLREAFAAWLDSFDAVLSYWPDPEGEIAARFPRHVAQRFHSAAALPTAAPAAAHFNAPLAHLGVPVGELFHRLAPRIPPPDDFPRGTIALHPGSGSPTKNWPLENWRALIDALDAPLLLVLGEVERRAWDRMPLPAHVRTLVQPPLETLVAQLSACRGYVGHDSGVSHLAAACGVPSVLLFGPTDSRIWAPPAPQVRVLQGGPSFSDFSLADVRRAVDELRRAGA